MSAEGYTLGEVSMAINRAAEDILAALDGPDTGVRDALNLLVNTALAYVTGEASTVAQVAEVSYSEDLGTVIGWINDGT